MKTYSVFSILILLTFLITGCASKPIVDTKGLDEVQYEQDLKECEQLADQVNSGVETAKGAVFGAAVGAAVGLVRGDAGKGAAVGGISGGAEGAKKGDTERMDVIKNCLRNRGYAVLN